MKLVVNMTMGSMCGALAEGMALAQASDLSQAQLLEVTQPAAHYNCGTGLGAARALTIGHLHRVRRGPSTPP